MSNLQAKEREQHSKVPIGAIFRYYNGKNDQVLSAGPSGEDLKLYAVYEQALPSLYPIKDPVT